jgi:hypothetical protein
MRINLRGRGTSVHYFVHCHFGEQSGVHGGFTLLKLVRMRGSPHSKDRPPTTPHLVAMAYSLHGFSVMT